ncbi:MAG: S9 family peptidase [Muribaculaceae bacterium]|nr:S9 family peptidase [Muribaculaceae bacterium]
MKGTATKMSIMLASTLLATGCADKNQKENVIEKPEITVENGMLTPEVLESFGRISEMTPSPAGKQIAFCLTYESIEENKGNSEIYIMETESKELKRLTTTAGSENSLQWIDGGERLAFLAPEGKDKKPQICSIKPDGSDRKVHSDVEAGVECFVFSPDSKRVVYGSTVKPFDKDSVLFDGLDKTTGRVVNDLMYKHWDEWVTEIPHPFVADIENGKVANAKDIMEGEPFECPVRPFGGAESFAWSPDGKSLVYCAKRQKGMEYSFSTNSDLYLYDIEKGETVKNLTEGNEGYDTDPQYSPDGKSLAWLSMATPKYESDKKRLMVMDCATGEKRDLTEGWDYWPEEMKWGTDGKEIYFNAYYEGTEPTFKINVATCAIDTIAGGMWDYNGVTPTEGGKVYAMRHNMLQPNEIVEITNTPCNAEAENCTELTEVNKELLAQLAEVKVEKRMVATTDGKQMTCWLILPPGFDENKKYPSILYCQGGPQQAVSQFWSYRWNFRIMAANGYVIIAPNRRGVPGFGEEWNRQISGDYGGQNMKDYLAAADYLLEQPYIDPKGMSAIGASYGGFSVYWLAGHHDNRFAALIAHAGIFNLEAQYLETEEMFFADFDLGGPYWDKSNAIAQKTYATSPHRFVENWTAPILVTVGELDYRILASQGMMAFNAAKMRGLEAEMVVFPDENHWVLKPQNAILWQRAFFQFLDKYCKHGE